jgi:hypothetical protein
MYIDNCQHTFEILASEVLPGHMERLKAAIAQSKPGSRFADPVIGPRTLARNLGLQQDFSGCYVLLEGETAKYVGISRKVLSRLRQHFRGKTHFDASLAYSVAQRKVPTEGRRSEVMAKPAFQDAFQEAQRYLQGLSVAYVDIENPLELYVFEAYAAMALGTFEWNTFRTH